MQKPNAYYHFYTDRSGKFYVKSQGHVEEQPGKIGFTDVLVEIPKLDPNTFKDYGLYMKDSTIVLCVFENSDGGNYVKPDGVDPPSFKAFYNVFGGKDSFRVFYQNKVLHGLHAKIVKAYSDKKNCTNCEGYFSDNEITYYGAKRMTDSNFMIPKSFKFVE